MVYRGGCGVSIFFVDKKTNESPERLSNFCQTTAIIRGLPWAFTVYTARKVSDTRHVERIE